MIQKPWKHLYNSSAWKALRIAQLCKEPTCKYCSEIGKVVAATVADHIKPHKGNEKLFLDPNNLQSLCKTCHDMHKQRQEHTGVLVGGNTQGYPIDPSHHWNK